MPITPIVSSPEYLIVSESLNANGDKLPILNIYGFKKINIDVTGTFVATVAIKAGRNAASATVRAQTSSVGLMTADLLETDSYAEIVVTAYTSGTVVVSGEIKKKIVSESDILDNPTINSGVAVESTDVADLSPLTTTLGAAYELGYCLVENVRTSLDIVLWRMYKKIVYL